MITEWKDLEGRTIKKGGVHPTYFGGYLLFFEDGEIAHIDGDGEEIHGSHWPILREPYEHCPDPIIKEVSNGFAR